MFRSRYVIPVYLILRSYLNLGDTQQIVPLLRLLTEAPVTPWWPVLPHPFMWKQTVLFSTWTEV